MSIAHGSVAARLAALLPDETVTLVSDADRMADRFDRLANQRPATCGAYALSYLLEPLGFSRHGELDLTDEDALAHLAAVAIEDFEVEPSEQVARRVAAGELTEADALREFGSVWYRYPVRSSADPAQSGTSPTGVARAIAIGTGGALATVPVPGRGRDGQPQLTPERWEGFLDLIERRLSEWSLHGIFNYESDQLLRPESDEYQSGGLLRPDASDTIPRDDWGVGHFAGLAGMWRRPWGERWFVLFDTYKERGFDGYQPQPAELMRRALVREDGRGGGLLLVVPRAFAAECLASVTDLGLEIGMWDNLSLDPDDWAWEPGR